MPLSLNLIKGNAAFCLANNDKQFAITLLVGFNYSLRGDELRDLELKALTILHPEFCTARLENSKGAKRKGQPEVAMVRDSLLIACVSSLKVKHSEDYKLCKGSYIEFCLKYKTAAAHLGLVHPRLTPHGSRRWGATWPFLLHISYASTQAHGRWVQAKTAKEHIDEATAKQTEAFLSDKDKLAAANKALTRLMQESLELSW